MFMNLIHLKTVKRQEGSDACKAITISVSKIYSQSKIKMDGLPKGSLIEQQD